MRKSLQDRWKRLSFLALLFIFIWSPQGNATLVASSNFVEGEFDDVYPLLNELVVSDVWFYENWVDGGVDYLAQYDGFLDSSWESFSDTFFDSDLDAWNAIKEKLTKSAKEKIKETLRSEIANAIASSGLPPELSENTLEEIISQTQYSSLPTDVNNVLSKISHDLDKDKSNFSIGGGLAGVYSPQFEIAAITFPRQSFVAECSSTETIVTAQVQNYSCDPIYDPNYNYWYGGLCIGGWSNGYCYTNVCNKIVNVPVNVVVKKRIVYEPRYELLKNITNGVKDFSKDYSGFIVDQIPIANIGSWYDEEGYQTITIPEIDSVYIDALFSDSQPGQQLSYQIISTARNISNCGNQNNLDNEKISTLVVDSDGDQIPDNILYSVWKRNETAATLISISSLLVY